MGPIWSTEMSRPFYENSTDVSAEKAIAKLLMDSWGCDLVRLPRAYPIDFCALRLNKIIGWVEVKRRHRTFEQYPNCFLSLHKVKEGRELSELSGIPCLFAVQFNDALAYVNFKSRFALSLGGRTDRKDWQDVEPMAEFSMSSFKIIKACAPDHSSIGSANGT